MFEERRDRGLVGVSSFDIVHFPVDFDALFQMMSHIATPIGVRVTLLQQFDGSQCASVLVVES